MIGDTTNIINDTITTALISDTSNEAVVVPLPEHVKARADLKKEVLTLIEPYQAPGKRPPFSAAEMIIMAIICGTDTSYGPSELLRIVVNTFPYYGNDTLNDLLDEIVSSGYAQYRLYDYGLSHFIPDFEESFHYHDVPLIRHEQPGERACDIFDHADFTVNPTAARIFLAPQLCSERKGTFPFFRLPAELRNVIYEMVLRFHSSGIVVDDYGSRLLEHPEDEDFDLVEESEYERTFPLSCKNIAALLMVCKQANAEATPILYGQNKFAFQRSSLSLFDKMATAKTSSAFLHLRKLQFDISPHPSQTDTFERVAQLLASVKKFVSLSFSVWDSRWFAMSKDDLTCYGRKTKFRKVDQFPGFYDLAKAAAKAEKFELEGECPRIKEFFDGEIANIKAGKGYKAPKKRGAK